MTHLRPDYRLHLPSLAIKKFRGIDELTIPRLGRVTLLAGKNGVGKTTVLDAVRIYAGRANARVLSEVLTSRDEFTDAFDVDGNQVAAPDWHSLFRRQERVHDQTISIGRAGGAAALELRVVILEMDDVARLLQSQPGLFVDDVISGLLMKFRGTSSTTLFSYVQSEVNPATRYLVRGITSFSPTGMRPAESIVCNATGPDNPDNIALERFLNSIALTPGEQRAIDALNMVTNDPVERVAALGEGVKGQNSLGRRIMVLIKGSHSPVPLRSLGDGAVRIFAVALALANSANGFLLIDEAENGIHHSIQAKFWNMVLQTAERNNVQVIATTHSWDCVVGFAKAANELEDVEGVLYRIQRNGDRLRAVEYPESDLANAAKHRIEVR